MSDIMAIVISRPHPDREFELVKACVCICWTARARSSFSTVRFCERETPRVCMTINTRWRDHQSLPLLLFSFAFAQFHAMYSHLPSYSRNPRLVLYAGRISQDYTSNEEHNSFLLSFLNCKMRRFYFSRCLNKNKSTNFSSRESARIYINLL